MKLEISERNWSIIAIALAYIFAISARLIWVYMFNGEASFKFNGEFILTNSDGFYFATMAKDIMNGLDVGGQPFIAYTIIFFYKILPFSFETIIFYIPIFLGSLVVIPIFLIGKLLDTKETGFVASMIGGIVVSYYNRTMVGYLDTDMLNIVFPMFLLYFLLKAFLSYEKKYFIFIAISIVAYINWYASSYSLLLAFVGVVFLYLIYQHFKVKNENSLYILKVLIIMAISITTLKLPILVGILVLGVLIYLFSQEKFDKYIWYILAISIALAIYADFFAPIIAQMQKYIFKGSTEASSATKGMDLKFFNVINTVKEAQAIPFEIFAKRVSGDINIFFVSMLGLLLFLYKRPILLLSIPMIIVGIVAYGIPHLIPSGGLRFTIYLVPIASIGLGYLIVFVSKRVANEKALILYPLVIVFTVFSIVPNISHIKGYKIPPVMNNVEIEQLNRLKSIVKKGDYVVSWWDYGYQLEYYTGAKTLGNGGRNDGTSNFYTSYMLTKTPQESAKMARLDVELETLNKSGKTNIEKMMEGYGFKDTNKFLNALRIANVELPTKTKDIYFYLPNRMVDIYNVVERFSNIDLMNGSEKVQNPYMISYATKRDKNKIYFTNGLIVDFSANKLFINNKPIPLNTIFLRQLVNNKIDVQGIMMNDKVNLFAMYDVTSNKLVISNANVFNSVYFKLFMLSSYNKDLFEYVEGNYFGAIYRLKI